MTTSLSDLANFQLSIDDRSKSKHPTGPRLVAIERARRAEFKEPKIATVSCRSRPQQPKTCARGMPLSQSVPFVISA